MGGGTVYAAQDSLPGDALYQAKLGTEQVMMWLGDDVAKAERALSFAERRVGEIIALAEKGCSQDLAVEKYGYALSMTLAMAEFYDDVPEEAKELIEQAMEGSFEGYETITRALEGIGVNDAQLPVIPEMTRKRMEDILGWTDAPKVRIPTGRSPGWSCPSCRC